MSTLTATVAPPPPAAKAVAFARPENENIASNPKSTVSPPSFHCPPPPMTGSCEAVSPDPSISGPEPPETCIVSNRFAPKKPCRTSCPVSQRGRGGIFQNSSCRGNSCADIQSCPRPVPCCSGRTSVAGTPCAPNPRRQAAARLTGGVYRRAQAARSRGGSSPSIVTAGDRLRAEHEGDARKDKQGQQRAAHDTADDDGGERSLDPRSPPRAQRHRNETQRRDQRRHEHRANPHYGRLLDGLGEVRPASCDAIDHPRSTADLRSLRSCRMAFFATPLNRN